MQSMRRNYAAIETLLTAVATPVCAVVMQYDAPENVCEMGYLEPVHSGTWTYGPSVPSNAMLVGLTRSRPF
jgi:hypothetical protein